MHTTQGSREVTHLPEETLKELAQVIPLRPMNAEKLALEEKLEAAFFAKEQAREALLAYPAATEILLLASTYAARLATYANIASRIDALEAK